MAYGLEQLVNNRDAWRLQRRMAGAVEREFAAGAGEERQYHGMVVENVFAKDQGRVVVKLEHGLVERQHIRVLNRARQGLGCAHKAFQVLRHCLQGEKIESETHGPDQEIGKHRWGFLVGKKGGRCSGAFTSDNQQWLDYSIRCGAMASS